MKVFTFFILCALGEYACAAGVDPKKNDVSNDTKPLVEASRDTKLAAFPPRDIKPATAPSPNPLIEGAEEFLPGNLSSLFPKEVDKFANEAEELLKKDLKLNTGEAGRILKEERVFERALKGKLPQISDHARPECPKEAKCVPTPGREFICTLKEALASAYLYNVDLENARVEVKKIVEEIAKANCDWHPDISIYGKDTELGARAREHKEWYTKEVQTQDTRTWESTNKPEVGLDIKQNLFRGWGTLAARDQAYEKFRSGCLNIAAKEQEVFKKVIDTFMDVVAAEESLVANFQNERNYKDLLEQTTEKHKLGQEAISNVATAKAKLADAVVKTTATQAELHRKRADLEELIGNRVGAKMEVPEAYKLTVKALPEIKKIALTESPAYLAAQYMEKSARFGVAEANSKFLPILDVEGSISKNGDFTKQTNKMKVPGERGKYGNWKRQGTVQVTATLTIPLYKQGLVNMEHRAAQQDLKKARLDVELKRRDAENLCEQTLADYMAGEQNVESARISMESNEVAMQEAKMEYILGEKTFFDVLQVEEYWIASYLQLIKVRADFVKSSYGVLMAEGRLRAHLLALNVPMYNPHVYYDRYNDAWFSLGEDALLDSLFPAVDEMQKLKADTEAKAKAKAAPKPASKSGASRPSVASSRATKALPPPASAPKLLSPSMPQKQEDALSQTTASGG